MAGRVLMPFPNQRIIPDGWAEYHRPVAAGVMTGACTVDRVDTGPAPWPPPEDWTGRERVWSGQCRIQELKREQSSVPVEQPTESRQYLIQLPYTDEYPVPELRVGERGDIVTHAGVEYILKQRMTGTLLWTHDFTAVENQTQQNP